MKCVLVGWICYFLCRRDGRDLGDLSSCGVDEFGIGIRMTCESPATLDRLCEQDSCPLFQRGSLAA